MPSFMMSWVADCQLGKNVTASCVSKINHVFVYLLRSNTLNSYLLTHKNTGQEDQFTV